MSGDDTNLPGMIGRHPAMLEVYRQVRRVAHSHLPVLIVGETGTGKELVARALYELGAPTGPFVDVNCAAVPEGLAEGEFFGWERGAFTGAHHERSGLVETANGGTLFLDEACSLPLPLQTKLLRVLEHRDFRHVGGRKPLVSDFRLITAVSEPLGTLVATGRMRSDFAFRIAGVTIALPPLHRRGADVRLLAQHFVRDKTLDPSALAVLARHQWPGNVRELKTLADRLVTLLDQPIVTGADVIRFLDAPRPAREAPEDVAAALAAHDWNVRAAAQTLGVGHNKIYRLIRKYRLTRPSKSVPRDTGHGPWDTVPIRSEP